MSFIFSEIKLFIFPSGRNVENSKLLININDASLDTNFDFFFITHSHHFCKLTERKFLVVCGRVSSLEKNSFSWSVIIFYWLTIIYGDGQLWCMCNNLNFIGVNESLRYPQATNHDNNDWSTAFSAGFNGFVCVIDGIDKVTAFW